MMGARQILSEAYLEEYSGFEGIQTSIAMTFVATLFLSLRFYFKLKVIGRSWGIEDTLLVAAYIAHEGLCVLGFRKYRLTYPVIDSQEGDVLEKLT